MAYLQGIGIKNFRVFKNETYFDFSKINVLTGPNNSGKSSMLKLFQLIEANGSLKELDLSKGNHNLGEFDTLINYSSKEKEENEFFIKIPVSIKEINRALLIELQYSQLDKNKGTLSNLTIIDKVDEEIIFKWDSSEINYDYLLKYFKLYIKYINDNLEKIERSLKPIDFKTYRSSVPDNEYSLYIKFDRMNKKKLKTFLNDFPNYDFTKTIFEYNKKLNISTENENEFLKSHFYFPYSLEQIKSLFPGKSLSFSYLINGLPPFVRTENKETNSKVEELLKQINNTDNSKIFFSFISDFFFKGIIGALDAFTKILTDANLYVQAIKGIQSREYYIQNKDDVYISLLERYLSIQDKPISDNKFLNKWLQNLKLGDSFEIERHNKSLLIPYVIQDGKKINLADLGYGVNQIISLLMKIRIVAAENFDLDLPTDSSILFIEEPEANLHPAFQSKLADLFVDASEKFNIQFIIETHSEYIVKKLQFLTANKDISTEDTVIYYFHHPDHFSEKESQIKKIRINETGGLSDNFGRGFLDEGINITFDLIKLNKSQHN